MIVVEQLFGRSVAEQRVEIVERKGRGHPDSICDALMESISVALSSEYCRACGTILHHNIDKGLLAAGSAAIRFGGGKVLKPMELVIGDRATDRIGKTRIPVKSIAVKTAKEWFSNNLRFVDPEKHLSCRVVLAPGSAELTDIFAREGGVRGANDTSALIGYYPLSPTEKAVLGLERHLNSKRFKERFPETGEDIKVMGLRTGGNLDLTVAMPLIARFITSERQYFARKEEIRKKIVSFLRKYRDIGNITVGFNTLDIEGRGLGGIYLSLLGTSAEAADSGQVGRGNRVNGLISVNRPMGTEAAAGKNPISHVGKIYNQLAHKTAEKIYKNIDGINEVYILLLSRIGTPIDEPHMAAAQLHLKKGFVLDDVARQVRLLVESELSGISDFCSRLAAGEYPVC